MRLLGIYHGSAGLDRRVGYTSMILVYGSNWHVALKFTSRLGRIGTTAGSMGGAGTLDALSSDSRNKRGKREGFHLDPLQ